MNAFLARLDTARLQVGDAPTRALVVVNAGYAPRWGRVRFRAAFPVRASVGAQPVSVRAEGGAAVPSRLVESTVEARADLPPDRRLWTMTLEFAATDIPARGWRAYAATFVASAETGETDAFWDALTDATDLLVRETDCHAGDLPMTGTFALWDALR